MSYSACVRSGGGCTGCMSCQETKKKEWYIDWLGNIVEVENDDLYGNDDDEEDDEDEDE